MPERDQADRSSAERGVAPKSNSPESPPITTAIGNRALASALTESALTSQTNLLRQQSSDIDLRRFLDPTPQPVYWEQLATPMTGLVPIGSWNERPTFTVPYHPRAHIPRDQDPAVWNGCAAFSADWDKLASSYNSAAKLSDRYDIRPHFEKKTWEREAPPQQPQGVESGSEYVTPDESSTYDIGSSFDERNQLDTRAPFDISRLSEGDKSLYKQKRKTVLDKRGAAISEKVSVDQSMNAVKIAFSKVTQAEIKVRVTEAEGEQVSEKSRQISVRRAKDQVQNIVKSTESIFKGLSGEGKEKVSAGLSLLTIAASEYYDQKLAEIAQALNSLDGVINRLGARYEVENVRQAKINVDSAKGEVTKRKIKLDEAIRAQNAAFDDFGATIERLASKMGMSEADAKTMRTAAAAIPHIEETISKIEEIEANVNVPGYSHSSGLGAGVCQNLHGFVERYSILRGYKRDLGNLKRTWIGRRNAAARGLGINLPQYR